MNPERLAKLIQVAQGYAHDIKLEFTPSGAADLKGLLEKDYDSLSVVEKDRVDFLSVIAIINSFNEAVCEDIEPVEFPINPSLN